MEQMLEASKIIEGEMQENTYCAPVYVEGRGRNVAAKRFMVRTTAMAVFTLFLGDFRLNFTRNLVDGVEGIDSLWGSGDAPVRLGGFIAVCPGGISIKSRDSRGESTSDS